MCFLYQDNYQNKVSFCFSPTEVTSRARGEQVTFIQIVLLHSLFDNFVFNNFMFVLL